MGHQAVAFTQASGRRIDFGDDSERGSCIVDQIEGVVDAPGGKEAVDVSGNIYMVVHNYSYMCKFTIITAKIMPK